MLSGVFCLLSVFALFFADGITVYANLFIGKNGKVGAIPSLVGIGVLCVVGVVTLYLNNMQRKKLLVCFILILISLILILLAQYFYQIFNGVITILPKGYRATILFGIIAVVSSLTAYLVE